MKDYTPQKEYRCLFIDELGVASPKDISPVYILSGCMVLRSECENLKVWADKIKFKYWGHDEVVFHSREFGRKENQFSIFKNEAVFTEFLSDLKAFLLHADFHMFFVVVDKKSAMDVGWDMVKIYRDTTLHLLRNFLLALVESDSKGEIVVETASAPKDIHMLEAFNNFLSSGLPQAGIDSKKVRELLTSVSFVTKRNDDIEEQIADLFAYAAKLKFSILRGGKDPIEEYDRTMLDLINKKLFKVEVGSRIE